MTISEQSCQILAAAQLTGRLSHNSRTINEQAIRELMAENPYWSLASTVVEGLNIDEDDVLAVVVKSFGITMEEFMADEASTISPERTAAQLVHGLSELLAAAKTGATVALATGHPGSLAEVYRWIGELVVAAGGSLWLIQPRTPATHGHFLDQVGGVIMLSDEGSLMHTHEQEGLGTLLSTNKPDWLLADHGFAAAGIDVGIPTVAIYDTDDPAIPLAASVTKDIIAIPMNDNQTNSLTAAAVRAFWTSLNHG
ncbi:phosphatase [Candidatus Saccharibacteria bacterium]|nr:phosphatase [Candidatus Saccharibacteria bacterium]